MVAAAALMRLFYEHNPGLYVPSEQDQRCSIRAGPNLADTSRPFYYMDGHLSDRPPYISPTAKNTRLQLSPPTLAIYWRSAFWIYSLDILFLYADIRDGGPWLGPPALPNSAGGLLESAHQVHSLISRFSCNKWTTQVTTARYRRSQLSCLIRMGVQDNIAPDSSHDATLYAATKYVREFQPRSAKSVCTSYKDNYCKIW